MTTCLVVQHVAPESAFAIGDALVEAGVSVETCRIFAGDAVPSHVQDLDGIVVMGGPMSAASDDGFPSRPAEIRVIVEALGTGVPVLGVCLGAQILAVAAGAAVYPGASGPEIGWGTVSLSTQCADDPLFRGLSGDLNVLHWHGDTFDLPVGAVHLAGNANYVNQAFRLGQSAWGVQFHLEVTEPAVQGFVSNFGTDAAHLPHGPEGVAARAAQAVSDLETVRQLVFGRFADLMLARSDQGSFVD